MARKSAESLSVITNLPGQRAEVPERLTGEAADIWREIVASKPHDWFTSDTCHLLEAYCHAVVAHRLVSVGVAAYTEKQMAEPKGVAVYDQLTKMQERQARVMATIATKLRLTQQSRYTPQAAATASKKVGGGARPWDA
jgi:phage terminase small subunit